MTSLPSASPSLSADGERTDPQQTQHTTFARVEHNLSNIKTAITKLEQSVAELKHEVLQQQQTRRRHEHVILVYDLSTLYRRYDMEKIILDISDCINWDAFRDKLDDLSAAAVDEEDGALATLVAFEQSINEALDFSIRDMVDLEDEENRIISWNHFPPAKLGTVKDQEALLALCKDTHFDEDLATMAAARLAHLDQQTLIKWRRNGQIG